MSTRAFITVEGLKAGLYRHSDGIMDTDNPDKVDCQYHYHVNLATGTVRVGNDFYELNETAINVTPIGVKK